MAEASFNHWGEIAKALKPALRTAISTVAVRVQARAIANAPRDTGFLKSSIYSVTPDGGSTYGEADSPPGDAYLLPEATPDNDMEAVIGVAANYGAYVEFGTRFMPAQPYFYPAVIDSREDLDAALGVIEPMLQGSIR